MRTPSVPPARTGPATRAGRTPATARRTVSETLRSTIRRCEIHWEGFVLCSDPESPLHPIEESHHGMGVVVGRWWLSSSLLLYSLLGLLTSCSALGGQRGGALPWTGVSRSQGTAPETERPPESGQLVGRSSGASGPVTPPTTWEALGAWHPKGVIPPPAGEDRDLAPAAWLTARRVRKAMPEVSPVRQRRRMLRWSVRLGARPRTTVRGWSRRNAPPLWAPKASEVRACSVGDGINPRSSRPTSA